MNLNYFISFGKRNNYQFRNGGKRKVSLCRVRCSSYGWSLFKIRILSYTATQRVSQVLKVVWFLYNLFQFSIPSNRPEFQQPPPPTFSEIFKRLSSWKDEVNISRCVVSNIVSGNNTNGTLWWRLTVLQHLSEPDPISRRPDWIRVRSVQGQKTVDPVRVIEIRCNF